MSLLSHPVGSPTASDHGRFVVCLPNDQEVEVLIKAVEHICVFGHIHLSTSAIAPCLHHPIPLALFDANKVLYQFSKLGLQMRPLPSGQPLRVYPP